MLSLHLLDIGLTASDVGRDHDRVLERSDCLLEIHLESV
jgi:hypothetical protein